MNAMDVMWLLQWCELKEWKWHYVWCIICHIYSWCDVIHTVFQRSYVEGLWGHSYFGCSVRYRGSDGLNTVHGMSLLMWRNVINGGCDTLYRVPVVKHIVCAVAYIQRVWYHGKCGCETLVQCLWWKKYSEYVVIYNGYDVDVYIGWDLINTFGVISSIEWMWWQK